MARPSYASVTATLALFLSLGGGAYAAATLPANSVGAKQLKKNAVERAKLKNNAVDGTKILDRSITGDDIDEVSLAKVPEATNADSANNAIHATAAATLDRVVYRTATATAGVGAGNSATAGCDPGLRVIGGGVRLDNPFDAIEVDSFPDAGNTAWTGRAYTWADSPGPVNFTVYAICTSVGAVG
jgi:hypothetical protein